MTLYLLATCTKSRAMTKDYKCTTKLLPSAPRAIQEKRGLKSHLPLKERTRNYYALKPKDDRWMKRHTIFSYVEHLAPAPSTMFDTKDTASKTDLQKLFNLLVNKLNLPKSKR